MYDIESFVTRNFDDYAYYGNPATDIKVSCPFCESRGAGEDTKKHLHIHMFPDKQVVHCFRCGYSKTWVHFVMDHLGISYWKAISEIYVKPRIRDDIKGKVLRSTDKEEESILLKDYSLPKDFQLVQYKTDSLLVLKARKYLHNRGFSKKMWEKHKIGVADSLGWRVVIPIEDEYWQARGIFKWVEPKYINPKKPARHVLFNSGALEMYDEVVICEGAFSAMSVGDNAIALIGKEPTHEKTERLLKSPVTSYIIALEPGAYQSLSTLMDKLIRSGRSVTLWKYTSGDPADGSPFVEMNYDFKSKIEIMLSR